MSGFIGQDVPRVDGPAKVTGSARYSGEITLPELAYAQIVGAQVASGDGNWLIGTGMSAAAYPVAFFIRTQRARAQLYADSTAVVQTSTQEFGTGTPTVLTQVAADALGVELSGVRVEFGDTSLPATGSPVGSNGAMMISAAVHNAGTAVRDQLIALAVADPQSPLHGTDPAVVTAAGGRLMLATDPGTGETYAALMGRTG